MHSNDIVETNSLFATTEGIRARAPSAADHHIVGDLGLAYKSLDLRAEPGVTMTIDAAEPNSLTAHALALLASWAATQGAEVATQHS